MYPVHLADPTEKHRRSVSYTTTDSAKHFLG